MRHFATIPTNQRLVVVGDGARLEGDVFHETYPANAFEWLAKYSPVTRVGKTLGLHYIPAEAPTLLIGTACKLTSR